LSNYPEENYIFTLANLLLKRKPLLTKMSLTRAIQLHPFLFSIIMLFAGAGKSQSAIALGSQAPNVSLDNLVQGRLYVVDYYPVNGSQFLVEGWQEGSIFLLDNEYHNLFLRYDTFADVLILLHRSGNRFDKIQLNREYIRHFMLENRSFINLSYSRYRDSGLEEGFYEVIFEEKVSLLAKRILDLETREALTYFLPKSIWYLIKDGHAYKIRNKKSLFEVYGSSYKKQISTFLKKEGIRFRKAGDPEWRRLIAYLNTLL